MSLGCTHSPLAFTWLLRQVRSELGKLLLQLRYPLRGLLEGRGSWLRRGCGLLGRLHEHRENAAFPRLSEHLRRGIRLLLCQGRSIWLGRWGRDGRGVGRHVQIEH